MHTVRWALLPSALVLSLAAAPARAASCRAPAHQRQSRCHVFEPLEGTFSTPPPSGEVPVPGLSFIVGQRPPRISLGRVRMVLTCEPSGAQVELEGGLSQRGFKLRGRSFSVTSPVVQGPIELFEEGTAGTVRFSGHFTSRTAATVTAQVSGLALPRIYAQGPMGEALALTGQTCSAGPLSYHVTRESGHPPPFRG
jgi:hypothetical protein